MSEPPRNIAALIGNGLSIAYNNDLLIHKITAEIVSRFKTSGGGNEQARLMAAVAERAGRSDVRSDFEQLVSPFDELKDTLPLVAKIADLAGASGTTVAGSLREAADFADLLYRHGVSHILEVIAERSRARDDKIGPLQTFVRKVADSAGGGEVTFANLNYDALLMAALCKEFDLSRFCDLTDGRADMAEIPLSQEIIAQGRPLRTRADFPFGRKIFLLHLHGSLAWLREPGTNRVFRMDINDLRSGKYWDAWRNGQTDWAPAVVLTNQTGKQKLIAEYPFSLAYETFEQRLLTADKWLIAGTSLRDDGVKAMLKRAWQGRAVKPQVLVVTLGSTPTNREIENAIGYDPIWAQDPAPAMWLNVYRDGLFSAPESTEWFGWDFSDVIVSTRVA